MGEPEIRLYVKPGDAPRELFASIFEALSDLQREFGGRGLSFRRTPECEYTSDDREMRRAGIIPMDMCCCLSDDLAQKKFLKYLISWGKI